MSSNIFVNAGAIAIIFLIMKFIEMRFIEKENKPLKELIKDTLIVYISVLSGFYLLDQLSPMMESVGHDITPAVFTGNPEF
jgi:hypothetical protein